MRLRAVLRPAIDGDLALADHVDRLFCPLWLESYAAVRQQADVLITAREDAWRPVALELADWLSKAEARSCCRAQTQDRQRSVEVAAGQRPSAP